MPTGNADRNRLRKWAQVALEGVPRDLSQVTDGRWTDKNGLKASAIRLGSIARHGLLTDTECLEALHWACDTNGYAAKFGAVTTERRIKWYFEHAKPCDLPPPRPTRRAISGSNKSELVSRPWITDDLLDLLTEPLPLDAIPGNYAALGNRYLPDSYMPTLALYSEAVQAGATDDEGGITRAELMSFAVSSGRATSAATIRNATTNDGVHRGALSPSVSFGTLRNQIHLSLKLTLRA